MQLREFDRCRQLYNKFLEFNPANCATWTKYAEFETELGDFDRARAIYELAVSQDLLDMPEVCHCPLLIAMLQFAFYLVSCP